MDASPSRLKSDAVFATTHWTRVLATRGESPEARTALGELCAIYYEPVVAFLRARFREEDRARELAHEFFERLLERNAFSGVDPQCGRFRNYLLGAVKHFLADRHARERAIKRGAGAEHVVLEPGTDTSPGIDPADRTLPPPELAFDRQWALTILDRVICALTIEHDTADRRAQLEALKPFLTGGGPALADVALRLGLNEGAVKVAIHRLRKRFRELVKTEIGRTVEPGPAVQEEMSHLIAVLSAD